jgi:hypothetical protein
MSLLIYSGLLYLLGISIVLILKPELMFGKDGTWKEFGLGRNKVKYTWLPFWLFSIMWAIISYVIILVIASNTGLGGVSNSIDIPVQTNSIEPNNVSMKAMTPVLPDNMPKKRPTSMNEMKPGYYILDTNETIKRGVPKYIFLGPEAPNLVYHNSLEELAD